MKLTPSKKWYDKFGRHLKMPFFPEHVQDWEPVTTDQPQYLISLEAHNIEGAWRLRLEAPQGPGLQKLPYFQMIS